MFNLSEIACVNSYLALVKLIGPFSRLHTRTLITALSRDQAIMDVNNLKIPIVTFTKGSNFHKLGKQIKKLADMLQDVPFVNR